MPTISYFVRTSQAQAALTKLQAQMTMTSGVIASGSRMADAALMVHSLLIMQYLNFKNL